MFKDSIILFFCLLSTSVYSNDCFNHHAQKLSVTPLTQGPLILTAYYCVPKISRWVDLFVVSPDGKQAAFLSDRTVTLSALNNSDTVSAGFAAQIS